MTLTIALTAIGIALILLLAANWNKLKRNFFIQQIVKMRVAPKRLKNIKTPADYGMKFTAVDIWTPDKVRLSAWEIPAPQASDKIIIINHPLNCTRYGSVEGMDDAAVEFLPMVKHLHDNGYNILMYDHRGQGDSDGGVGKQAKGCEAPVGAGATEWQDVIGALQYVQNNDMYKHNKIALLSQCMGANATFLAASKAPNLFTNATIKCLVAIQPTISLAMVGRVIQIKTKMDLAQAVEEEQQKQYGFGFAKSLEDIKNIHIPTLFAQVRKDQYTYDSTTGKNDIEYLYDACPSEKELVWIGSQEAKPFGTDKRFEGYGYFNKNPEQLLVFLDKYLK